MIDTFSAVELGILSLAVPSLIILLCFYLWRHLRQASFMLMLVLGEVMLYATGQYIQGATPIAERNDIYYFKLVSIDFFHILAVSAVLFSASLKYRAGITNDENNIATLVIGIYGLLCLTCVVCNATQGIYDFMFSSQYTAFIPAVSLEFAMKWNRLYESGINGLVNAKWLVLMSLPLIGGYQSFKDWLDGITGSHSSGKNAGGGL